MKGARPSDGGRSALTSLGAYGGMRVSILCALSLMVGLLLCPFGVDAAETSGPPISSGSEIDYPPFSIVNEDGRADGFSVELMRAALGKMGREVTFRTGPWAEVRGWLERGEVDALPLVGRTPEREALFDFTVPYLTMHGAIVVREETADVHSLADLRGRRVGAMKGDNAEEFLRRKDRGIEIFTTPTFSEAFRALAEGRCDAVVVQRLVALRLLGETGLSDRLRIVDRPILEFAQDWCFAVTEGDRETLAILNEGLALAVADGTHRRLHAKWFAHLELPSDRPIVIGGDYNYPPFEFLDEKGRPAGFTVELTQAIAREMNLDIRFRLGSWAETLDALKRGDVDVVQGMFYTPERDRTLEFSSQYLMLNYIGVANTGAGSPPETLADLAGRSVAVQGGDAILGTLAEQAPDAQIVTVETQEDVLRAIADGKAECGVAVRTSALHFIEKNEWSGLQLGKQSLFAGKYCYAVAHGQDALLAEFAEGLRVLKHTGEFRRIHEKWLGVYEPGIPKQTVLKYIAIVAGPLILIALLALVWLWLLRRQVALRTRQVREAAELQRALIACSPVAIYSIDAQGIVQSWNASAERVFGWQEDEVIGKLLPIVPEEKQEEFTVLRRQVMNGRAFTGKELVRKRKDGTQLPISLSAGPIYGSGGEAIGIMAAAEDITERRRAERVLQDSEKRYRRLFEAAHDGILILDAETGEVVDVNPFLTQLLGYTYEEFVGKHVWEIGSLKDIASSREAFRILQRDEGIRYEHLPLETADGRLVGVEFVSNVYMVDNVKVIQCNIRDITERKRAEARIDHLNRVLRAVRNVNQLITHEDDRDALLRRSCEILISTRGYRSAWVALRGEDGRAQAVTERGIGEDFAPLREAMERGEWPECCRHAWAESHGIAPMYDTDRNCKRCPLSHTYRDTAALAGALRHGGRDYGVLVVALPAGLAEDPEEQALFRELVGDVAYALHSMETAQRRREEETRFRSYVENAPYGVFIADREGRYVDVNPAASDITGYSREELLAMRISDLLAPDTRELDARHFQTLVESGRSDGEIVFVRKDGEHRRWHVLAVALSGDRYLGFVQDVTERDRLQSQLLQAQKMETVGRLAGGVAHDFNNLLTGIKGFVGFALDAVEEGSDAHGDLTDALVLADRAAGLTRQLLAFSRRQTLEPVVLDLNKLIEEQAKMLTRLLGEDIELQFMAEPDLGSVRADPGQIEQVIMNLAVNARDAMPSGGKLTIETANVELGADYANSHVDVTPGPHVMLAVNDTGCGMDEETREKVFEPFFTTKGVGKGTGLGLPMVYGIVKQHGGNIWVYSEPGKGATFKVYLPRVAAEADQRAHTVQSVGGGPETVLLVEDDNAVREVGRRHLEALGYTVLCASCAREAEDVFQEQEGRIDLLLTDVVMPGRNGRELYESLVARHGGLKVLFMSGYTDNAIVHHGVLDEGMAFLQKPFEREDLADKVRQALER